MYIAYTALSLYFCASKSLKKMQLTTESLAHYPYISYVDYKSEAFELRSIDSANLVWNSKYSLKCKINTHEMVIPSNSIILLDKGNSFSCESNDMAQIKVLRFNTEVFSSSIIFICGFINTHVKKESKTPIILFYKNEQTPIVEDIFLNIAEILKEDFTIDIVQLKAEVCDLLQEALQEKFEHDANYINRFGEILNSQFNILHNVSDYALQLKMEPKNLLRNFQKQGLKNPSDIIKEKLLLEIKRMIIYTNKSMRDICFEIGFYDPAYFSRFFKKHVGVTAQNYRKQYSYNFIVDSSNGK
jgi:AraC-like DNA-binding protein